MSLYDRNREDRNPRSDLPVLMLFPTVQEAEAQQRRFHPAEFLCLSVFGPQLGYRARAIFVFCDHWRPRGSAAELQLMDDVLTHWRCRLAPGCTDQFHYF